MPETKDRPESRSRKNGLNGFGGEPPPDHIVEREIFIEDLVMRAFTDNQIYVEAKAKFGVITWSTVRHYIKRAHARIERRFYNPENVAETRARLRARMQQLEAKEAWSALAKIEELAAKVDGAIAPVEHNVHVQSSMTPELGALFRAHVARMTGAVEQAMLELMPDEDLRLRILARAGEIVARQGELPVEAPKAVKALTYDDVAEEEPPLEDAAADDESRFNR